MTLAEAILSRRTIFRFRPDPVPTETLERILSFGIWAPNHHLTEPWRFTVVGERAKRTLAGRYAQIQMDKAPPGVDPENRSKLGEAGYAKFMSKPTILAVSCLQEGDEQRRREDYAAACCAVQNIQLAAWDLGIGMQWSTGPIAMEQATYDLLGLDPDREGIIGFFYMGCPGEVPKPKRKPLNEVIRWTP